MVVGSLSVHVKGLQQLQRPDVHIAIFVLNKSIQCIQSRASVDTISNPVYAISPWL